MVQEQFTYWFLSHFGQKLQEFYYVRYSQYRKAIYSLNAVCRCCNLLIRHLQFLISRFKCWQTASVKSIFIINFIFTFKNSLNWTVSTKIKMNKPTIYLSWFLLIIKTLTQHSRHKIVNRLHIFCILSVLYIAGLLCKITFWKLYLPSDNIRLCAPGTSGQQGISEWMEGATGQEHQRGSL